MFGRSTEEQILIQLLRIADSLDRAYPIPEIPDEIHDTEAGFSEASDQSSWQDEKDAAENDPLKTPREFPWGGTGGS